MPLHASCANANFFTSQQITQPEVVFPSSGGSLGGTVVAMPILIKNLPRGARLVVRVIVGGIEVA